MRIERDLRRPSKRLNWGSADKSGGKPMTPLMTHLLVFLVRLGPMTKALIVERFGNRCQNSLTGLEWRGLVESEWIEGCGYMADDRCWKWSASKAGVEIVQAAEERAKDRQVAKDLEDSGVLT